MIVDDNGGRIWKEVMLASETKGNHDRPQSGWLFFMPRLEPGTF
jgi:hypothetical protein